MSYEEQKIEQLKKLKDILKRKLDGVNYQIQQQKIKKEQKKLKHIKNQREYNKN